jgi:hypothetical protein
MSKVEELERELQIHTDIYEIARDKWLETQEKLTIALNEEAELERQTQLARRNIFLYSAGITFAVIAINLWFA